MREEIVQIIILFVKMEVSKMWNWIKPKDFGKMEISILAGAGLVAVTTLLYKNWDKILAKGKLNLAFRKFC